LEVVDKYLKESVQDLSNILKEEFEDTLCSVAIFGSVARGDSTYRSDIDILVVHRTPNFRTCWTKARSRWEERNLQKLKNKKLPSFLSPIFFREEELSENPLILLDVIDDGVILFDTGVLKQRLMIMKKRLAEVGAKKVYLGNGRWYWDLKPDWKPGERFKL
jgi:hypothetical protein